MKIKKQQHSAGKEHKGVPVILSLPCYWDQTPLAAPWAPAVSRISRSVYVHNSVSWPRHWKSKRSVVAGVAGALLNKHSTPVFLPPRPPPPLPFPSVYKHTLSHRHRKAFRGVSFSAAKNHVWKASCFCSTDLTLLSCSIFYFSLFNISLALSMCLTPLSLSRTHTLSVIYFHWVVFEGLMCFSPAMACLFFPLFLITLLSFCTFPFLIAATGSFSSQLL